MRDPRAFAHALNMALLKPGVDQDCLTRTPDLAVLKQHPGLPGKPGAPTEMMQLEEGVSAQSRFYLDAEARLLTVSGDSPDALSSRAEWDSFVWDSEVPILTIVISATGNDTGLQFCRPRVLDLDDHSGTSVTAPVTNWPGWDNFEGQWKDYCQSGPAIQSVSAHACSEWLTYVLSQGSCRQRLASGGLVDVLFLGCFTHRLLLEVASRDLSFAPPGSVRLVAFKAEIPTDACMVALYSYRLASTRTDPAAFEEHVVPSIKSGLQTFQQVHLKWRDVDEASTAGVRFEDTVVWRSLPNKGACGGKNGSKAGGNGGMGGGKAAPDDEMLG